MVNHPNRPRRAGPTPPGANPRPDEIAEARARLSMTHAQAAELIYASERAWQEWEGGRRRMHPALWELWKIKVARL